MKQAAVGAFALMASVRVTMMSWGRSPALRGRGSVADSTLFHGLTNAGSTADSRAR